MAVVFALCAAYVAYCLGTNPAGPFTTPDSFHYLNATPIVPLGYPFFLKLVGGGGAIVVQPILFAAALAFLGSEIVKLTRSTWLAAAVVAGSMLLPQIREFHASVLSESLFLSLLIVFLALCGALRVSPDVALDGADRHRRRIERHRAAHRVRVPARDAGDGVDAASPPARIAARSTRAARSGQAGVVLRRGAGAVLRDHRRRAGRGAAGACRAVVQPDGTAHVRQGGADRGAARRPPSGGSRVRAALDQHLQTDYAPIRALLASAPADVRGVLSIYYETCLQGGCVDRSRALMPDASEAEQTAALGRAGTARIRRAPLAFAQLLALNYQSLWTVDRLRHPDRTPGLNAFIASHRPMPFEKLAFSLEPDQTFAFQPSPRVRYLQLVISTDRASGPRGLPCSG